LHYLKGSCDPIQEQKTLIAIITFVLTYVICEGL